MVPGTGLEPVLCFSEADFKSAASADSAIQALLYKYSVIFQKCQSFSEKNGKYINKEYSTPA